MVEFISYKNLQNNVGKVLVTLRYYLIKNKLIVDLIQVKDFIEERQSYGRLFTLVILMCITLKFDLFSIYWTF